MPETTGRFSRLPEPVPLAETVAVQEVATATNPVLAWAEVMATLRFADGGHNGDGGDGD